MENEDCLRGQNQEPKGQKPRTTENHTKAAGLELYQETGNMCLPGCHIVMEQ